MTCCYSDPPHRPREDWPPPGVRKALTASERHLGHSVSAVDALATEFPDQALVRLDQGSALDALDRVDRCESLARRLEKGTSEPARTLVEQPAAAEGWAALLYPGARVS